MSNHNNYDMIFHLENYFIDINEIYFFIILNKKRP